jgi:tyrosyl-tRNA synthetase
MRTADADVERYLKLFTFLPLDSINLLMTQQAQDPSKRLAQRILAREIVELAHGAAAAKKAELAHKDAFGQGTNTFSLLSLRNAISSNKGTDASSTAQALNAKEKELLEYKQAYAASSSAQATPGAASQQQQQQQKPLSDNIVTLPLSMLQPGSFPHVLHAAGLATSRSEASRLIAKKGAYVIVPNSGSVDNPTALKWATIEAGKEIDPNHYLVDWEALVLRAGKSKIQICRVVRDELLEGSEEA